MREIVRNPDYKVKNTRYKLPNFLYVFYVVIFTDLNNNPNSSNQEVVHLLNTTLKRGVKHA